LAPNRVEAGHERTVDLSSWPEYRSCVGISIDIEKRHVVLGAGVVAALLLSLGMVRMCQKSSIASGGDVTPADVESTPFQSTHLGVSLALPKGWQHESAGDRAHAGEDGVSSRSSKLTRDDSGSSMYLTLVSAPAGSSWEISEKPTPGEVLAAAKKIHAHHARALAAYELAYSCVGAEVVTLRGRSVARCQGQLSGASRVFHTSYILPRPDRVASVVLIAREPISPDARRELEALVASIEL
jgi:hypothetical protein